MMRTANTKRFRTICLTLLVALGLALTFTLRSSRVSAAAANLMAERQLMFDERVAYQRAIEEVYWRGRLWPAANPQPKPAIDAVMSRSEIEAKVADYLRKSQALEDYWQRPISAEQLQAEMDRMARETRRPDTLRELYRALGDDPLVVAECLARPALVERLIRNWYAHDERFHGELKQRAERELLKHSAAHQLRQTSGEYAEVEWTREERAESRRRGAGAGAVTIDAEEWQTEARQFGRLREDKARFYVMAALEQGKERMKVAVVEWRKEPFEQWWARAGRQIEMTAMAPAATGSEYRLQAISAAASAGAENTWAALANAPAPRYEHTAVWTGSEMIVWSGFDSSFTGVNTGGRYNPASDTWTATSLTDAPAGRRRHTAVWTGSEMIVWGGQDSSLNDLNNGGRYFAQAGPANTPPTIAGTALTRTAGSPAANSQIAAVNDAEEPENSLTVTVNGAANATANGVTVNGLSVNSSGQVTASVAASCTATTAAFTLRVTDGGGLFDEATLDVTVNPNPPPSLGTYSATSVAAGSGATVTPNAVPSDNGSVANLTASAPGFSGMLDGNPVTGAITITNANPPGSYTVTVTATDNCGATATTTFSLAVTATDCSVTVNPATLPQPYLAVLYSAALSASPAGSYTFSVSAGALPPGLQLKTEGGVTSIAGVPTTPGTYNFTIKARLNGTTCEGTRSYTVTIPPTVVPILECVRRNADRSYTAYWGYDNSTGAAVTIPVGANNRFTPGNQNRGQTTVFQPGRVTNAFSVTFARGKDNNLGVWQLRGPDGVLRPVNALTTSISCP